MIAKEKSRIIAAFILRQIPWKLSLAADLTAWQPV